ncbi:MAG: hypothetical protein RBG13Loki_0334 [Promethearchaeota archaeon CR_4]|nr:MAG: hypothetical protein RBG13Loki_0334 [Candidatus Lokiarchaeota archaeon CR_4]
MIPLEKAMRRGKKPRMEKKGEVQAARSDIRGEIRSKLHGKTRKMNQSVSMETETKLTINKTGNPKKN